MLNHRERRSLALARPLLLPAGLRSPRPSSGLTPDQALDSLRAGLDYFFAETSPAEIAAERAADRHRVQALRREIADRIEADIAILDALTPDADLEDGHDVEDVTLPMRGGCAA